MKRPYQKREKESKEYIYEEYVPEKKHIVLPFIIRLTTPIFSPILFYSFELFYWIKNK